MTRLRRIARNVGDLTAAANFYEALGFRKIAVAANDPQLAMALNAEQAMSLRLQLGRQELELTQIFAQGGAYPTGAKSNDVCFQHIAIKTRNIAFMQSRALLAGATPISKHGPQLLPKVSGGVIAWKFRDPEGHPLEFLEIPALDRRHQMELTYGYDHSAICVTEMKRSIQFYEGLGLTLLHRHANRGPEQARLDGLEHGMVEVVAMVPPHSPPHVELLGYPGMITASPMRLNDIATDRLVFAGPPGQIGLIRDPDGHVIVHDGRE
jgi:catechol 2,3-dioxygenase-like lactoylglutathione lyase family enzyme